MEFELSNVKLIYEKIAINFSDKRFSTWNWIDDFIISIPKGSTILDIGCGNGRNMKYPNYNFYGIDNCSNFVKLAKQITPNVYLSDMTNLPFDDNTFDAIISIASYHHLSSHERREQALKEMYRVLKPNGKILISIWSINQTHNKKLDNKFTYGDNIVPFKNNKGEIIGNRYYYIFQLAELYNLLNKYFLIDTHEWIHGNEVFVMVAIDKRL